MRDSNAAGHATRVRAAVAKPLYGQVRDLVLQRICNGDWQPGATLPNEFELAAEFDVSIGTVRRALETLQNTGVVVRKQGRGTFVASKGAQAIEQKFHCLRSLGGQVLELSYRLSDRQVRPSTAEERAKLHLPQFSDVVAITQNVFNARRHVGVEIAVLSSAFSSCLCDDWPGEEHLYHRLAALGHLVARVDDIVRAAPGGLLGDSQPGRGVSVMLHVERMAFDQEGTPVEMRSSRYVGSEVQWSSTDRR